MIIRRRGYGVELNPGGAQEHMVSENFGTVAAATTFEIPIFRAHVDSYIWSAFYTDTLTIASNGTNFMTLQLTDRDATGTTIGTIGVAFTGATTGITAYSPVDIAGTTARGYKLIAGHTLSIKKTVGGTGAANTFGLVTVTFK